MRLSTTWSSIVTAITAAATVIAADKTLPHSWNVVAQVVVVAIASLIAPVKKP